jgi:copper chaperone NosL
MTSRSTTHARLTLGTRALLALSLALLGNACGREAAGGNAAASLEPEAFDGHECGACGMIVREQPAPRAQLVHRDGERVYFCAVGDLLTYIQAPSSHGQPVAMWVETLDPAADADDYATEARPWRRAEDSAYVTDIERRVMGQPLLTYDDLDQAEASAIRNHGRATGFSALRESARGAPPP